MALVRDSLLPFIETDQYQDFTILGDYSRSHGRMVLAHGDAGAGKTASAMRYRDSQPLITANGLSPILYFQLSPSDKTDRAFYNTLVEAMTAHPDQHRTAAAALAEAKRLLQKYRYDAVIIDEVGFLQESGLEAVRTLHDQTGIAVILITMPRLVEKLARYPQFYSRIAQFLEFGLLSKTQIKESVLPNVSRQSHVTFDPTQDDADAIVEALYIGAGGSAERGSSFRDIVHILEQAYDLIEESIQIHDFVLMNFPSEKRPPIKQFDAKLVCESTIKAKRRGKQPRKRGDSTGN